MKIESKGQNEAFSINEDEKLLTFIDNDDDEEETAHRRLSSAFLTKILAISTVLIAIVGVSVSLAIIMNQPEHGDLDDDYINLNSCFIEPSCQNIELAHVYDKSTGFTNNTGWSGDNLNSCCNICLPGMNATVCNPKSSYFNPVSKNCSEKNGDQDFDYLLFDLMWIPQFCNALAEGHDPTLSHIAGTKCNTSIIGQNQPQVGIHGLWPNYYDGYPQCCNASHTLHPLVPSEVEAWEIWSSLQQHWFDPTTSHLLTYSGVPTGTSCSTCYLLNHEWEKHGGCFSPAQPEVYFTAGLNLFSLLHDQIAAINSWNGTVVPTANISALFNKSVNVICDALASSSVALSLDEDEDEEPGMLLEIQSCWDAQIINRGDGSDSEWQEQEGWEEASSSSSATVPLRIGEDRFRMRTPTTIVDFVMVDCSPAFPSTLTKECPQAGSTLVSNFLYQRPS